MISRRELLISTVGGAAALVFAKNAFAQAAATPAKGPYTLPQLPYAYDALEPHIDAETMTIHHTKHHQAYIDKLNAALPPTARDPVKPISDLVANYKTLPENLQMAVRNQGGGHLNHSWFWTMMAKPGTGGSPSAELAKELDASFGGMDGFKKEFLAKATGQFGSGWAWLIVGKEPGPGKPLAVVSTPNQDNPLSDGMIPLSGIDVWEHAYYLKYKNLRPAYVEAWFNVIHWDRVNELRAGVGK